MEDFEDRVDDREVGMAIVLAGASEGANDLDSLPALAAAFGVYELTVTRERVRALETGLVSFKPDYSGTLLTKKGIELLEKDPPRQLGAVASFLALMDENRHSY